MTSEGSVRGLRCAEAIYPAGMRLAEHIHEHASITVVAGGGLVELGPRGRSPAACRRGVLVARPAAQPHANDIGGDGVINLEIEIAPSLLADHHARIVRAATVARPAVALLGARLRCELRAGEEARSLLIEAVALELIALALEPDRRQRIPPGLARAYERIREQFREKPSMAALAREAGLHPVSFARDFRARYGISPGELMRQLRIEWAADQLLRRPQQSIATVAAEAGFYDQSHFARAFSSTMGRTPMQHRRSHKKVADDSNQSSTSCWRSSSRKQQRKSSSSASACAEPDDQEDEQ